MYRGSSAAGGPPPLAGFPTNTFVLLADAPQGKTVTVEGYVQTTLTSSVSLTPPHGVVEGIFAIPFSSPLTSVLGIYSPGPTALPSTELALLDPPPAGEVGKPVLFYDVDPGAMAVAALHVYPGAIVDLECRASSTSPYTVEARAFAADRTRVVLPIPVAANCAWRLRVRQYVPVDDNGTQVWKSVTSDPVIPLSSSPSSLAPVVAWEAEEDGYLGDSVVVSKVIPGSLVEILDTSGAVVGSALLGEPAAPISVCPFTGDFSVRVTRRQGTGTTSVTAGPFSRVPRFDLPGPFAPTVVEGVYPAWPGDPLDEPRLTLEYLPPVGVAERGVMFVMHGVPGGNDCNFEDFDCGVDDIGYYNSVGGQCIQSQSTSGENSYRGFDYIGDYLARRGIRVVSFAMIPRGAITGPRIDAYADFVLTWMALHPDASERKLIMAGLSTGGEAAIGVLHSGGAGTVDDAAWAALNVVAAVALAPTSRRELDELSWGTDHDLPVLILAGSKDGFYRSQNPLFAPWSHVERLGHNVLFELLPGGNHSHFNTCWKPSDHLDAPDSILRASQERWTLEQVGPFVDDVLRLVANDGSVLKSEMLRIGSHLPGASGVAGQWRRRARTQSNHGGWWVIDDFDDEDMNPALNSRGGAVVVAGALTATEDLATVFDPDLIVGTIPANRALKLTWTTSTAKYQSNFATTSFLLTDFLSLDVNVRDVDGVGLAQFPVDFTVRLVDGALHGASVAAGVLDERWPVLDSGLRRASGFETVMIPVSAFKAANPDINLNDIIRVTLQFNVSSQGTVILDNLVRRRFTP